jgi:hypothetical protein
MQKMKGNMGREKSKQKLPSDRTQTRKNKLEKFRNALSLEELFASK